KKYKPVALKVRPVLRTLPDGYRIERNILGDPLESMPPLATHPPAFMPTSRYTQELHNAMNNLPNFEFLTPTERDLLHDVISKQNKLFAWDDTERGSFKEEYFPPIKIPVVSHVPWVERNIPIPPGIHNEVCGII
ncbi:hypothetical protein FA95DRAFT_1462548, partial [Auriscalpium vulgare]